MKCPFCGYEESKVVDSRPIEESNSIKRRRECIKCEKRFSTFERIETVPVMVIKKNGERVRFDRQKVAMGIVRACEKRPVSSEVIDKAVSEIETAISGSLNSEIESSVIGELVMEKLKGIDEVAYVRFASVYRQIKDVNTFVEEVQKLLNK